jgi:hypothetical protein
MQTKKNHTTDDKLSISKEEIKPNNNVLQNTNRHTDDIQEIITKPPSWILKWGILLCFGTLLTLFGISIVIRYPDTIKAKLKIGSTGYSIPVSINTPGKILKLYIKSGQTVKSGQALMSVKILNDSYDTLIIKSPGYGNVAFVGVIEPGHHLNANEEAFNIHPVDEQFFGVTEIPQDLINKIKLGQDVLIHFKNYPIDEYGQLRGKITYIADEPIKTGFFTVKINLIHSQIKSPISLKIWMTGEAEIITENISLQKRIYRNIFK